jgi:hypothetical protein
MPSGSFSWGNPSGTTNEKAIENNHYAVIAPANIRDDYPVPFYWFWTGPEPVGNTSGGAGNPATNDHTGNANGAVMVINAGTTLNDFYQRQVTLVPGNSYRLSVWMYLVNASAMFSMGVKDGVTNGVLGSYTSPFISTEDSWVQYSYDFTYPSSCPVNGNIKIFVGNAFSTLGGNDYYIDDISLTTIAGPAPDITCPSTTLPIKLENFNATIVDDKNIKISWRTSEEVNVKNFIVEKSSDGLTFNSLKEVQPSNTTTGNSYNVIDNTLFNTGNIYYRLKTVDYDDRKSFSKIVRINLGNTNNDIIIYPQPSQNGTVNLSWKFKTPCNIELFEAAGKKIKSWNGYMYNTLSINNLSKGMYFVRIASKSFEVSRKIVVGN